MHDRVDSAADHHHPARPAARRRPVRMRPVQGARRAGAGAGQGQQPPAGHLAPPGAGEEPGRLGARRAGRAVRPARRAGRSCSATAARPCSGTSPRSASSASAASTTCSASSRRSSPRHRAAAPHLGEPVVIKSEPGTHPDDRSADDGVDVVALTHNETSTGVAMHLRRPEGDALVVVDATSAAGGLPWVPDEVDVYYFAPQKCFASDGGLWLAACSPAAIERIREIGAQRSRWRPASLDLHIALDNSRGQPDLQHTGAGHAGAARRADPVDARQRRPRLVRRPRTRSRRQHLYSWAEARPCARPFVADPVRSGRAVVGTIDLTESWPPTT